MLDKIKEWWADLKGVIEFNYNVFLNKPLFGKIWDLTAIWLLIGIILKLTKVFKYSWWFVTGPHLLMIGILIPYLVYVFFKAACSNDKVKKVDQEAKKSNG